MVSLTSTGCECEKVGTEGERFNGKNEKEEICFPLQWTENAIAMRRISCDWIFFTHALVRWLGHISEGTRLDSVYLVEIIVRTRRSS